VVEIFGDDKEKPEDRVIIRADLLGDWGGLSSFSFAYRGVILLWVGTG